MAWQGIPRFPAVNTLGACTGTSASMSLQILRKRSRTFAVISAVVPNKMLKKGSCSFSYDVPVQKKVWSHFLRPNWRQIYMNQIVILSIVVGLCHQSQFFGAGKHHGKNPRGFAPPKNMGNFLQKIADPKGEIPPSACPSGRLWGLSLILNHHVRGGGLLGCHEMCPNDCYSPWN